MKQYQESLSPEKSTCFDQKSFWTTKLSTVSIPRKKKQILCNDADAHKKQRESLPPEKKVKILRTNADAHKEKWESLSPEDKDLFVKKNVAAQHKKPKPLSHDQRAWVLTIDTAEHKNTKSLYLLNKKLK